MKKLLAICVLGGVASAAQAALIDDFESYNTGNLGSVASPPWTSVAYAGSANVGIGLDQGNKYLWYFYPSSTVVRGGARGITAIPDDSTAATLFLRFYAETVNMNHSFGLSSVAPGSFTDFSQYNVQMRVYNDGTSTHLDVRSGGSWLNAASVQPGTWYNVWAVIDQTQDRFDVYLTTGLAGATEANKIASGAGFRVNTTASLVTFAAIVTGYSGAPSDSRVRIDDIYQFDGVYLANPVPEPATTALAVLGAAALLARKRR